MWDTVKGLIGSAAPMVGTLLGGPAGGALGGMIASALGCENTPQAIEHELRNNPEALVKITQIESNERIALKELVLKHAALDVKQYGIQLKDVQHAREAHSDHWMPSLITLILALMVTGMFASLMYFTIPEGFDQVLIMIAGSVLGAFGTSIAYWLGSSKGSSDKSKQIKGLV